MTDHGAGGGAYGEESPGDPDDPFGFGMRRFGRSACPTGESDGPSSAGEGVRGRCRSVRGTAAVRADARGGSGRDRDDHRVIGAGPQIATVEDFTIATTAGEIGARRYEPDNAAATIFWIHGGGWVICDLDTHDAVCRLLAKSSGCRVVAVDYRRAPEHPFPAPLEDCWDALGAVAAEFGTR